MSQDFGFFSALLGALAVLGCASAAEQRALACEGVQPTRWYLTEVAPTLPSWQQNPDRLLPATERSHPYQGTIELSRLDVFDDELLTCWADFGDKLAALALGLRIHTRERPHYSTGEPPLAIVEHYYRIAARDESPSRPCPEPFCHGVPYGMVLLAYYRGYRDDEQQSLLKRGREGGVTLAIYALRGESGPPVTPH